MIFAISNIVIYFDKEITNSLIITHKEFHIYFGDFYFTPWYLINKLLFFISFNFSDFDNIPYDFSLI